MKRPSILFVCLGNICRSPLAEAAFRDAAAKAGLDCEVDSAGTGDWHTGHPPDKRAQAEALTHGIAIRTYRARQVCAGDYTRFDHIIAMDRSNRDNLLALAPDDATAQISLLLDYVKGRKGDSVADPYYGDAADFARCWTTVSAGAVALVRLLRDQQ
jgi:protein-tyrosine phosphatase